MNRKKVKIVLMVSFFLLIMFVGCKENNIKDDHVGEKTAPIEKLKVKIEEVMDMNEENVVITLDKFDYFFYKDTSSVTTISFDIYSLKELKETDIVVSLDVACPYTYEVLRLEDEKLELFNFMSYLGVDWKELYRTMTEETDRFEETINNFNKQYEKIKQVPVLHSYNVCIQFDLAGTEFFTDNVSEIDVIVDGESHKISTGNIRLDSDFKLDRTYDGIELNNFSYFEVPFDVNKEGTTVFPEFSFVAKKDIRIDDFKLSHPNFQIQSIELQIENNGNVRNEKVTELDGVEIREGSNVTICVTARSEKLADAFSYGASGLQVMEYTVMDNNESQKAFNEFIIRTRLQAFDFYGYYIDGIDILSYYYDYYNPLYGY